ncbi:HD domain-containing protein [Streptomyces sp. NPDC003077]|uniref:HD domain-containing protein n=1 Tax=Streptomyces sp. NPDC003077 TaxID=3154443 RepID=UPI0033BEF7AC
MLLSHLLGTAAVTEALWDGFLAPSMRRTLNKAAGGADNGRRLLAWLCGMQLRQGDTRVSAPVAGVNDVAGPRRQNVVITKPSEVRPSAWQSRSEALGVSVWRSW